MLIYFTHIASMFPESEHNWFKFADLATTQVNSKIAYSLSALNLPVKSINSPLQAHWFLLDTLYLANQANRDGMHANALALLRQCIEAISIIEIGMSNHQDAGDILSLWQSNKKSAGQLRQWLEANVWKQYGLGLWGESWTDFYAKLASAVQPYAHYSGLLAQWQSKLISIPSKSNETEMVIKIGPRLYDPQKATRITLYHILITYALGRIWVTYHTDEDPDFNKLLGSLGEALRNSKFLDGSSTDWSQQFWSTVLFDGKPIP